MPLVTAAQFGGLTPNIPGAIQSGLASRQLSLDEQNKERLRQQTAGQLATRQAALGVPAVAPADETQAQAQQRAVADDPVQAKKILDAVGVITAEQKEDAASFATNVLAAPETDRVRLINERVQKVSARGGDAAETLLLLDLDPAQQNNALQGLKSAALTELQRLDKEFKTGKETSLSQVQSSSILPGGVVQLVRKDGTVEVVSPEDASLDIVKRAEERGVNLQQRRAQGRELGKDAGKVSSEVAKQVGTLRSNNASLRQVVREVEGGAETGPLVAKMPSFRAESIRLDQLRNKLGLDVVGSVTFGALSEGELNLAMSTALPTKLDGPELIKWAQEKIAAQEKLATYLEDQSIFLAVKGNTPAGWLEHQRSRGQGGQPDAPSTVGRFTVQVVQ